MLLCLGFAVLLFSAGEAWSLPGCPGSYNQNTWTNCVGTKINNPGEFQDKYVGEFKDGKAHGEGTVTFVGTIIRDGKISLEKATYVGEFKDGKVHGNGTLIFYDASQYIGEFKENRIDGKGAHTSSDGRVLNGVWEQCNVMSTIGCRLR